MAAHVKCQVMLAALAVACLSGCDGATSVHGTVTSERSKPVKGARVSLTLRNGRSRSVTSDADGRFDVGLVHAPSGTVQSTLVVAAEGFSPTAIDLVGTASYECKLVLHPATELGPVQPVARERICTRLR
jgi:carboxypeptidase family protein